jgi:hypothetical protein
MKSLFCQRLTLTFMLSSQPQAGVSKHATRPFLPVWQRLAAGATSARAAEPPVGRASTRRLAAAAQHDVIVFSE